MNGLKTKTNAGRPNWDKIFRKLQVRISQPLLYSFFTIFRYFYLFCGFLMKKILSNFRSKTKEKWLYFIVAIQQWLRFWDLNVKNFSLISVKKSFKIEMFFLPILGINFCQITTFIKVCVAFVFGLPAPDPLIDRFLVKSIN